MAELTDYLLEASYGSYLLEGASGPGSAVDLVGPLDTGIPYSCGGEEAFAFDVAALLASSVDLSLYEHLVLVAASGCGFNGLDLPPFLRVLRGQTVRVDAVFVNAASLYGMGRGGAAGAGLIAHELGHQLGLGHSGALLCPAGQLLDGGCGVGEYLDVLDVMGASVFFGHYNAYQKERLGWIDGRSIWEVTGSGLYFLAPYETAAWGPKALSIRRQSDETFYVEYRTPTGFGDPGVEGFTDGAAVRLVRQGVPHLLRGPGGRPVLRPGERLDDVRGHRITVLAMGAHGVLLEVVLAGKAELEPPQASLDLTSFPSSGTALLSGRAEDPSGIERIELYRLVPGAGRYAWTLRELLASLSPDPPDPRSVEIEHEFETTGIPAGFHQVEGLVFDREGNVRRWLGGIQAP